MPLAQRLRMLPGVTPPVGPTVLHQSTFTAANGTQITSYTPDIGNGYSMHVGAAASATIQSNRLRLDGVGGGGLRPITNIGTTNGYVITTNLELTGSIGSQCGIYFAVNPSEALAYWRAVWQPSTVRIVRRSSSGTNTIMAQQSFTPVVNTVYNLELEVTATTITFTFGAISINTTWDPTNLGAAAEGTHTYVGMQQTNATAGHYCFFDDFYVEEL